MKFSFSDSLSSLVTTLGHPEFPGELMNTLRAVTGADIVSAFEFSRAGEPIYLLGGGRNVSEARFSQAAGVKYARGYWRFDPAVSRALAHSPRMLYEIFRQHGHDILHPEYRAYCYESHDILERVSIFDRTGRIPVMLNLYRCKASGHFSPTGVRRLEQNGGVLGALVAKHAEITGAFQRSASPVNFGMVAKVLREAGLRLSAQEIEICASLLTGLSYKEIAQRRLLKVSSVITYRKRAYAKLGIRHREELASIVESAQCRLQPRN